MGLRRPFLLPHCREAIGKDYEWLRDRHTTNIKYGYPVLPPRHMAFLKGAAWLTAAWMISAPGKWSSVPPPLDMDKYSPCISLVLRY